MASNAGVKQASALNFSSEFSTDQVIFTKSDTVSWVGTQSFIYTTGLGDYCLPLAQYSLDGSTWFNQGGFDDTGVYNFATPYVTDDGVVHIDQSSPVAPQTLRIRVMCLAHPNQQPFSEATTGSALSYLSSFNYRKIAASGVINTTIVAGAEQTLIQDIPHNLGYAPNYMIFARLLSGNTFITQLLSPNARRRIYIDSSKLHIDNFMPNPFVTLQAYQYFYFIYYD